MGVSNASPFNLQLDIFSLDDDCYNSRSPKSYSDRITIYYKKKESLLKKNIRDNWNLAWLIVSLTCDKGSQSAALKIAPSGESFDLKHIGCFGGN